MSFPVWAHPDPRGLLTWQAQSGRVDQRFRYHPAGSTGAWQTVNATSCGEGLDSVDLTNLPARSYEFELL